MNPHHLIESLEYEDCNEVARNITPKMAGALPEIEKMISQLLIIGIRTKKLL